MVSKTPIKFKNTHRYFDVGLGQGLGNLGQGLGNLLGGLAGGPGLGGGLGGGGSPLANLFGLGKC